MICVVIVTLILLLLLCYKAYSTTFQRLYLYVTIATLFSEIVKALGIEHQFQYETQAQVCFWLGLSLTGLVSWFSFMPLESFSTCFV